jgi:hypothetical protein
MGRDARKTENATIAFSVDAAKKQQAALCRLLPTLRPGAWK